MNDQEFLMWIHARLEHIFGEDNCLDSMHHLRAIIKTTPPDRISPSSGTNSLADLRADLEK